MPTTSPTARLGVPERFFDFVRETLKAGGYADAIQPGARSIDMSQFLIEPIPPTGDEPAIDHLEASVVEAVIYSNEEAFRAGYTRGYAAGQHDADAKPSIAWSEWEPSEIAKDAVNDAAHALANRAA